MTSAHNDTQGADLQPDDELAFMQGCWNGVVFAAAFWTVAAAAVWWWK